jgi:hypothetical protein
MVVIASVTIKSQMPLLIPPLYEVGRGLGGGDVADLTVAKLPLRRSGSNTACSRRSFATTAALLVSPAAL